MMKKLIVIFAVLCLLGGCSKKENVDVNQGTQQSSTVESMPDLTTDVDVDLTILSSTMVYSEVYNIMMYPEQYMGKSIRMKGQYALYFNDDATVFYPAVIIADASACCSQGLEFVLEGEPDIEDGYPDEQCEITVKGIFDNYYEDDQEYFHLIHASIE